MGKGVTWRDMVRSIATARIVTRTAALEPGMGSQNAGSCYRSGRQLL